METTDRPSKRETFETLLRLGPTSLHFDARRAGVVLPPEIKRTSHCVLQYGRDMVIPIPDLTVDALGVSATLSFARTPYFTIVPWSAVYALALGDGRGVHYKEDAPADAPIVATAAAPAELSARANGRPAPVQATTAGARAAAGTLPSRSPAPASTPAPALRSVPPSEDRGGGSAGAPPPRGRPGAAVKRPRMYLFERGYVDFSARLRRLWSRLAAARGAAWRWSWTGPGRKLARIIVYLAIVAAGVALGRAYVLYEAARSGMSAGVVVSTVVAVLFVWAILLGWSVPATLLAAGLGGTTAAGVVAVLAISGAGAVIGVFTPYLVGLMLLTLVSLIVFVPMRLVHGLWLIYYRIAHRCPYDDCGRSGLPIHVCGCGAQYPDLMPSFYGIFYHRCRHDDGDVKLPTLDFLGRNKLPRLCGHCERPMMHSSLGELPEQPVLLVGAPGAGKSVYLRQAIRRLREQLAAGGGNSVRVDSAEQERDVDRDLALLDRGQLLAKTAGQAITAIGVAVRLRRPAGYRRLLQIYDAPGEHFETEREFGRKQILPHLGGVVLLVDPFSLPALTEEGGVEAGEASAQTPFQQVVSSLLGVLTTHGVIGRGEKCSVPLAVVLGKADSLAGTPAADLAAMVTAPPEARSAGAAASDRCRQALISLGGGNSVRALEHHFSRVSYFVVSALGRPPTAGDSRPFAPSGVEAPLLWLMGLDGAAAPDAAVGRPA